MGNRLEFDGERVIPGQVDPNLMAEHRARYDFSCQFSREATVLDLACGTGYGSAALAEKASTVYALDLSEEAVRYGKSNYAQPRIHFLVGDGRILPFGGARFDVVIAFEIFEHLADPLPLLEDIKRVLKPEGVLLLSTPNRSISEEERLEPNPFHLQEYVLDEFFPILQQVFEHVVVGGQNHAEGISLGFPGRGSNALPAGDKEPQDTPQSIAESQFFIAICSRLPYEKEWSNPFFYVSSQGNVLQSRNRHLKMYASQEKQLRLHVEELDQELQSRSRHLKIYQSQEEQLKLRIEELDRELQIKNDHIDKLIAELNTTRQICTSLQIEFEKKTEHIVLYQEELQRCKDNFTNLQKDWEGKRDQISLLESERITKEQQIDDLQQELSRLEGSLFHRVIYRLAWLGRYLKRIR